MSRITIFLFLFFFEGLGLIALVGKKISQLNHFVDPLTWEKRFVYFYSKKTKDENILNVFDPQLGWSVKPT